MAFCQLLRASSSKPGYGNLLRLSYHRNYSFFSENADFLLFYRSNAAILRCARYSFFLPLYPLDSRGKSKGYTVQNHDYRCRLCRTDADSGYPKSERN